MKQTLLHIGYHKTATTWMQREFFPAVARCSVLLSHDEVFDCVVSPHDAVFDPSRVQSLIKPRLDAIGEQGVPVVSSELLVGSPFSGARDSFGIAQRLNEIWPTGRVLMVVRSQIDALASIYKQYVLTGGVGTPQEFFFPPRSFSWSWFCPDYLQYAWLAKRYRSLFGEDKVAVLIYEDFVHAPREFAERMLLAMDLSSEELTRVRFSRVHGSLSLGSTHALRRVNWFERTPNNPAPLLHLKGSRAMAQKLIRRSDWALKKLSSEQKLRAWLRQKFAGVFTEGNVELGGILGRDLRVIGYD